MNGHSAEEKIKILYEDSLREIRELTQKLERTGATVVSAATLISERGNVLRSENEELLMKAVAEVKTSATQIVGIQNNINKAAVNAAMELMHSPGGPINQINHLVTKQQEALGWLNRATQFYEDVFITRPLVISALLGGLIGGAIVAIFLRSAL